jgi:hypothetical protein
VERYRWVFPGETLLFSVFSVGVQLGQIPDFGRGLAAPIAGNALSLVFGQTLAQTSADVTWRSVSVASPIEIRLGYVFNATVTQDLLPGVLRRGVAPVKFKLVQAYSAGLNECVPGQLHLTPTVHAGDDRE